MHVLLAACLHAQIPAGSVGTIAGTGINGYSGDFGPASAAQIEFAYDVAVDDWGNVYIADSWNHRIRKVSQDGTINVFAGTGTSGFSGDGGASTSASISFPRALAVDVWGNVFVSDSGNGVIRKIGTDGVIRTIAGNRQPGDQGDGGPAMQASFRVPRGLAVDAKNNLYIADSYNFRIRKVTPDGRISAFAGTGSLGNSGDGGPAAEANIGVVHSLAFDSSGNLYFTDAYNHSVRRVRSDGVIETISGLGYPGSSGDNGSAAQATLAFPRGLAVDQLGNVYIADSFNHRIRRVTPAGLISTVVGTGTAGFAGDAEAAAQTPVNFPYGLASDPRGNVYLADLRNYRVRKALFETLQERPALTPKAVVNAASARQPLSPGGLISIFGSNFGYRQFSASGVPLAPSLGGTSVIVNGKLAPMMFASPGQINAQLPWSITSAASLKVNFGGVESDPVNVPVSAATPGIFLWGTNRAVAQNADSTLNTAEDAVLRGEVIVLYATGLGAVAPPLGDGESAPVNPLAQTVAATTVRIGNVPAKVTFSGMAPGFVGLWQINAEVPLTAPTGPLVAVTISVLGAVSNEAIISVAETGTATSAALQLDNRLLR